MKTESPQDVRRILKKIRAIEIRTRHLANSMFAGSYHSAFKGQGMNFEEVREYQPGDEIRAIDWNVTARFGHPYIKQFTEERELNVVLMVDLSASGNYGSRHLSKREIAAEIAATLAFSAIRNGDKVGLLLFTDKVEAFIPPHKGRSHVLRVIREVLYYRPENTGTDIGEALRYLNRILNRRSIVFLISDFMAPDFSKPLGLASRRHDLIAVPVLDPHEDALPAIGRIMLEDEETGDQIEIDTSSPRVRRRFEATARKRRDELSRLLRVTGIDAIPLRTDEDYLPALKAFFERREMRRLHM